MRKIFVTGALGQIGSELVMKLRDYYGDENVVASDIQTASQHQQEKGPFEQLDVLKAEKIYTIVKKYEIDTIFHLAATLSATAEKNPLQAWELNMKGLINILEVARELQLKIFTASSIAAFGPSTPKNQTPQKTIQRPTTMYGITKVAGELLCDYYFKKYGVDTRSIRLPGLISYMTPPGGGTTDYAVEIYYEAVQKQEYTCQIQANTYMDMMYMPDAIEAIIQLMEADSHQLVHRNAYNISAISASPECFARSIQKHIPEFEISYDIDPGKQSIADSWPNSIDDTCAREEWGFQATYNLDRLTKDMLEKVSEKQITST